MRDLRIITRLWWLIPASLALTGCDNISQWRAKRAYTDYQAAIASNDLPAARQALTRLVAIQDNVADNWIELGKLQAAMGSFDGAYYSFTRANELNRGDPNILRALTEIALRGGNIAEAQDHGKELEIVSPGDPWAKLASGYTSLRQGQFDEAAKSADGILATSPYDANGVSLKARALLGENRESDALALLQAQVKAQPSDVSSLMLLAKIFQRHQDWAKTSEISQQVVRLNPGDFDNLLLAIEAALRSGNIAAARNASSLALKPSASLDQIGAVLDLWSAYWNSPQAIADAARLGASAPDLPRRLVYARFLNRSGRPSMAARLAAPSATLPVDADNAEANAVLAGAFALGGRTTEARQRFDAVLAYDSGNASALRGRTELFLRAGNPQAAIDDAQKLVTVLPQSGPARLLLARCYQATGDSQAAQRALWEGFQAIPGNEAIYSTLRATKHGNVDDVRAVDEEFNRQRDAKLNRRMF